MIWQNNIRVKDSQYILIFQRKFLEISYVHEKQLLSMRYLAEIVINEKHIMSYLLFFCSPYFFGLLRIYYQTHPNLLSNIPWDYSYDILTF